jgi:hypothetical protein
MVAEYAEGLPFVGKPSDLGCVVSRHTEPSEGLTLCLRRVSAPLRYRAQREWLQRHRSQRMEKGFRGG